MSDTSAQLADALSAAIKQSVDFYYDVAQQSVDFYYNVELPKWYMRKELSSEKDTLFAKQSLERESAWTRYIKCSYLEQALTAYNSLRAQHEAEYKLLCAAHEAKIASEFTARAELNYYNML